jgi:hypothetical protein
MDNTNDLNFKEEVTNDKGSIKIESPFEHTGNIVINEEINNNKIIAVNPIKPNEAQNNSNNIMNQTDTLDESIAITLKRDLFRIYTKLRYVIIPKLDRSDDSRVNLELKNWDLWGPLLFTLLLCM